MRPAGQGGGHGPPSLFPDDPSDARKTPLPPLPSAPARRVGRSPVRGANANQRQPAAAGGAGGRPKTPTGDRSSSGWSFETNPAASGLAADLAGLGDAEGPLSPQPRGTADIGRLPATTSIGTRTSLYRADGVSPRTHNV